MPFEVCWNGDGVVWEYRGIVTPTDVAESNEAIYGHPNFDSLRWELANFLSAKGASFSERDIKIIAAMDRAAALTNPRVHVAFVATDETILSLLALYQEFNAESPWPVGIFRTVAEATQWLDIDPHSLRCLHSATDSG